MIVTFRVHILANLIRDWDIFWYGCHFDKTAFHWHRCSAAIYVNLPYHLCSHRPLLNYRYLHKVALAVLCGSTGPLSDLRYSTGPLSDLRYSTGPLSDLRYRQVRLDLGFIVRMRDHQAPLPPITADCHRLLPAIIVAWEISRGYTRRQRYQIMVVQGRGSGLDRANTWTNSVLICDLWICQEMRYSLYVRRNARFFHLYENLKLQDRLISLTHYYLDKMAIIQDTRSYSLR